MGQENNKIEKIFMDKDYFDRTVLELITQHGFAPLLKCYKVEALLDELWVGKNSYDCDGRLTNFSQLTFMASAPVKKLPGRKIEFNELLCPKFEPDYAKECFSY